MSNENVSQTAKLAHIESLVVICVTLFFIIASGEIAENDYLRFQNISFIKMGLKRFFFIILISFYCISYSVYKIKMRNLKKLISSLFPSKLKIQYVTQKKTKP